MEQTEYCVSYLQRKSAEVSENFWKTRRNADSMEKMPQRGFQMNRKIFCRCLLNIRLN